MYWKKTCFLSPFTVLFLFWPTLVAVMTNFKALTSAYKSKLSKDVLFKQSK